MKTIKILLAVVYTALLLVMGYATFLTQSDGQQYASDHVYAAPWFFGLWALLSALSLWYLWRRQLWRRASVCLLHVSFLVILAGSAVTWFTASEGLLHIRQGDTQDHYLADGRLKPQIGRAHV